MTWDVALILGIDGLANGAVYLLAGLGLVLIFSVTRVVFVPFGDVAAFSALSLAAFEAGRLPPTVSLVLTLAALTVAVEVVQALRRGEAAAFLLRVVGQARDLAYDSLLKAAEPAGLKVIANERYARADSSVAGQVLKIVAARPDAVFGGGSGTPGALPYLALAERGYKGGLYGNHGMINADFVRVGGAAVDGLSVPSGPVMVADQLPADHPVRKVALDFRKAYQQVHGAPPVDAFSAYSYDALLVFADAAARAVAKAEPGTPQFRAALRDAIAATRELPGTHGVFTFRPGEPYGLDRRSAVVIRLDKGQWKLVP